MDLSLERPEGYLYVRRVGARGITLIDRELTRRAIWLPTVTLFETDLISRRAGHYRYNPLWGPLPDQLWVR